ncbi:hypothetical protein Dsin_004548 [Dipteronia sinensis]|uniref:DUF1985 domain-containing protein n=1 Tax=Dipteronia sinensis TaxID=43782 RepID=A0AAE0AUS7_9ROSI|nr:hypothetical protein Dsin_004548 [Dipteronia sinensis]
MDRGMKFSASIVHRLLLRELHHDGPEGEMRFMLGPHSVRISKVEFCVINGLKFGVIPDTTKYEMVQNGIHQRYFGGVSEVEYEQPRAVLRIGKFEEQYDAVKLCLLYMLNWILMGLDEREKFPLCPFLDSSMPWTVDVSGMRDDNRYLRIMGPNLGLVGRLTCLPMFARTALMSTAAERVALYYEGIYEGGSLYTAADRHDGSVPDPLHHTTAGPSHTEGSDPEFGGGSPLRHMPNTEGLDPEFVGRSPLRRKQVRFVMPGGVHSREDIGGHRQDRLERKIQDVMDAVAALWEDLRKSDQERDRQHNGWRSHDGGTDPATGPATEGDGPQTQGPRAGDTVTDQQMQVPGGTDTGTANSKRGWQLVSPYTDPCRPKRPRTLPLLSAHTFRPNDLADADQLAAYRAYKRNVTEELRDVDLMTPMPVPWFHRLQTNSMELEDTSTSLISIVF